MSRVHPIDLRAEAIFDALELNPNGLTLRELRSELIRQGLLSPSQNIQAVVDALSRLRHQLSAAGGHSRDEVITCERASMNSRYRLADTPEDARMYRATRASEIISQIRTLVAQCATERERYLGQEVFTIAAIDYLNDAARELSRGAAVVIAP
jgi:hypothetical protein